MERIRVESVSYSYQNKYQTVEAVKDVSCTFETGTLYAVTGESGSGKSTFLSLLAGLDCPDKGKIFVDGEDLSVIDRDAYRRDKVAVIYQAFHLFPLLTALENVRYPLEIQGMSRKEAGEQAKGCLSAVGISEEKFGKYPRMMSGGEQQRTAIARAMASGGKIVLADEPTGNLDTENEENVVELLGSLAHDRDFTVILVTHNRAIAERADVQMVMKDGRLTVKHGL